MVSLKTCVHLKEVFPVRQMKQAAEIKEIDNLCSCRGIESQPSM